MDLLDMIQARLQARLKGDGVNIEAVAQAADVSSKTLRRLRSGRHSPTLRTVNRVVAALDKLYPPSKGRVSTKPQPAKEAASAI